MKRPLRIVHTVSSLAGGGMEHFVLRLGDAQRKLGHDVSVVSVKPGPLLEQAEAMGLPTHVLMDGRGGMPARVLRGAARMAWLRPQILHAHNPTSLQYASVGKLVSLARLVVTDHAQTRGIVRVPHAIEWRLADAVVAVSKDTADKSLAKGHVPEIFVYHNGIDPRPPTRTRESVRAELGLGEGVVGVNVAGFVPVKAQDVLVRAIGLCKDRGARLTVLLAGDGPERAGVEALARSLGLGPDHVRFLGFRTDVNDLLAAADFFVLPSRAEGLPLSVLEAMSHRLPVVATPVGGNPELFFDGVHGLHVPVDDPEALARAMERLADDDALRRKLGDAGHDRVRDEFSFDAMTRRYEDLYYRLLQEPAFRVRR